MSGSIVTGNRRPFKERVQIVGLLWISSGKADFVLLMKPQINRKKANLPKLFFVNYIRAGTCTSNSFQY